MTRTSRPRPAVLQRPRQGWSSLLLLLGMLMLVGFSVADARLVDLGQASRSSSLVVLMLVGGLIGFVLARSSFGVVKAHIAGAAVGAGLILLVAGAAMTDSGAILPADWPGLRETMAILLRSVQEDLRQVDPSSDYVPAVVTYLVFMSVGWTTAQFAAFSVFRYGRGGPAVVAVGAVLFLNLGLASWRSEGDLLPVLPQLALFAALAMLLLMRLQLDQQSHRWARRHITDTGEVTRLFLRTGTLFVALTVVGASSLTLAATTGPHDPPLDELENVFDDVGDELVRWLPFLAVPPDGETPRSIGDSFSIPDAWIHPDGTAFTAIVDGDPMGNYWWMSAHDEFDGWNWSTSDTGSVDLTQGAEIEMSPGAGKGVWEPLTATIRVEDLPFDKTVIGLPEPYEVEAPVELALMDANDGVARIDFQEAATTPYEVRSLVRDYRRTAGAPTATELRAAGDDYPRWTEPYLQGAGDPSISGERTMETAGRIMRERPTAYDRAIAIQNELRAMEYVTSGLVELCGGSSVPDCVLTHGQGFCQYYASTMIMVLREMGIPSRMVRGYLPGRQQPDGSWLVENLAFHAWVEAFFPGYGWIRFDPTPGGSLRQFGQIGTRLPADDPEATQVPDDIDRGDQEEDFTPAPDVEASFPPVEPICEECDDGDDALAALIVGGGIAGLLLLVVGGLLFMRLTRVSLADGGAAYRGIVSLATRLGHGPHPSQTELEYVASLSKTLPDVRDDLYLVAGTRIETRYGQRRLEPPRRAPLRRAYRRIQTALVRMSMRLRRPA